MQLVPEMLTKVTMTSQYHIMMSWYASWWQHYFFLNPWPLKHRIQNKHNVIRASSPEDMCFNQTDPYITSYDMHVFFLLRRGKVEHGGRKTWPWTRGCRPWPHGSRPRGFWLWPRGSLFFTNEPLKIFWFFKPRPRELGLVGQGLGLLGFSPSLISWCKSIVLIFPLI